MNRVYPLPQLTEDCKFNRNFHILIFIWQGVLSAGAHAPRQGSCPHPCLCQSPSGPPHFSASGSIPTFCPVPSQPLGFSPPPPPRFPPVLYLSAWISRKPSRLGSGRVPAIGCLAVLFPVTRQTLSLAFNSVFCCCCRNIVSPPRMSFSLLAACSCGNGNPFHCLKCQM